MWPWTIRPSGTANNHGAAAGVGIPATGQGVCAKTHSGGKLTTAMPNPAKTGSASKGSLRLHCYMRLARCQVAAALEFCLSWLCLSQNVESYIYRNPRYIPLLSCICHMPCTEMECISALLPCTPEPMSQSGMLLNRHRRLHPPSEFASFELKQQLSANGSVIKRRASGVTDLQSLGPACQPGR